MDSNTEKQGGAKPTFARSASLAGMALTVGFMMLILSFQRDIAWLAWLSILFFMAAAAHFIGALLIRKAAVGDSTGGGNDSVDEGGKD